VAVYPLTPTGRSDDVLVAFACCWLRCAGAGGAVRCQCAACRPLRGGSVRGWLGGSLQWLWLGLLGLGAVLGGGTRPAHS
jgi:hypothetical protein